MKVYITASAQADLDEIFDYIAVDNPGRALTFTDELVDRCNELADFPKAYPLIPRYEDQGFRRRVYELPDFLSSAAERSRGNAYRARGA